MAAHDPRGTSFAFTDDVARGVLGHMNADHAADSLVIVRGLTDLSGATAAEAVGIDESGMRFRATTPEGEQERTVPWGREIRERADIRAAVVAWFDRAAPPATTE